MLKRATIRTPTSQPRWRALRPITSEMHKEKTMQFA